MPDINQLLEMSPPLILAICLNGTIWLMKKGIPGVPGWLIPWIAIIAGTGIYPLIADPGKVLYSMRSPMASQLLTGFMVGLTAIGTNQWFIKTMQKIGFWDDSTPEKPPVNS